MLLLSHPKSALHISGISKCCSLLLPGICLSLPGSHGALATRFSGVTSRCRTRLLGGSTIFVPLVAWRDDWDKRDGFLSAGDSRCPHSMVVG